MKKLTSQEQPKGIEESLEQFKELRRNLGPDAAVDQKRYLDEMIRMGEKALEVAVPHNRMARERMSPFSLSWRRVGKRLLLVAVVFVVTFALYAVLGWV